MNAALVSASAFHFFSSRFPSWYVNKRFVDFATFNCSNAHSRISSARLPSFRRSLAANSSNSRRRSCRTRGLSCAFHSPIKVFQPFFQLVPLSQTLSVLAVPPCSFCPLLQFLLRPLLQRHQLVNEVVTLHAPN